MKISKGDKVECKLCGNIGEATADSVEVEAVAMPGICETCCITIACATVGELQGSRRAIELAIDGFSQWGVAPRTSGFMVSVKED